MKKEKAKNVILYLLNKQGAMSLERLTYLLYQIEFDYYEKYCKKLIGFTFIKTKNGIKIK